MSVHYIIDGYNVINQIPFLKTVDLRQARDRLLSLISSGKAAVSRYNKITVVFDGKEAYSSLFNHSAGLAPNISVVFSSNESADDKIVSLVANAANPKIIVLVSDDRELQRSTASFGAGVMSVSDFLAREAKAKRAMDDDAGRLSSAAEREITEELKKIWLRKK